MASVGPARTTTSAAAAPSPISPWTPPSTTPTRAATVTTTALHAKNTEEAGFVADDRLAEQAAYYRRRAGEYDVTAYGDVAVARKHIAKVVADVRPAGRVLEIACGTGLWTEALAQWADTLIAVDAAPEAIALARERVQSERVT